MRDPQSTDIGRQLKQLLEKMETMEKEEKMERESENQEKMESERLGVCAYYIVGEFVTDARAAACEILQCPEVYKLQYPMEDASNPNFYELAPVMCYGDKSKGHNKICPRDSKPG